MTPTPLKNALAAGLYIVLIVLGISNAEAVFGEKETVLIPMAMLSLFVFSAALMGLLFLAQPLRLYFEGKTQDGLRFFIQTILWFAGFAVVFFTAALGSSFL